MSVLFYAGIMLGVYEKEKECGCAGQRGFLAPEKKLKQTEFGRKRARPHTVAAKQIYW